MGSGECNRGGIIINIGSSSSQGGRPAQGAYAASKAGVQAFTETLALEGKDKDIYAFCVIPRRTDTTLRQQLCPDTVRMRVCVGNVQRSVYYNGRDCNRYLNLELNYGTCTDQMLLAGCMLCNVVCTGSSRLS